MSAESFADAAPDPFVEFCAAGLWTGLGRTLAGRLAEGGVRSPDDVTADKLQSLQGVGPGRAEKLVTSFGSMRPAYDVVVLLVAAGLPARLAAGAVDALGDPAAAALGGDPWLLLDVTDVRPAQADALARSMLGAAARRDDVRRGRALVRHLLLRAARDGHTAMPVPTMHAALSGLDAGDPDLAVAAAVGGGRVVLFDGEHPLLALEHFAMAEDAVADGLQRLMAKADPLCDPAGCKPFLANLDDAQADAVRAVAAHGVSVLTGGPGTGKSRTVAAVVALANARGARVALAAPTGRAAKRLEELAGEEAMTLHRLLGAQGTSGNFARGEMWPLDADLIVVDEVSMLDAELAAALVEACADGTRLLLVGDPAQLPSIGAGRVLGDVVDSEAVPVTELRTLYRQAEGGAIARLAASIREGELPPVDDPTREVVVVLARDAGEAAHRVVQLVTDSIPRALSIPAAEVQVVTPVHRGPAGTMALNAALKEKLNPGPGEFAGFDAGDRVVATANHLDDGFANGEVGVVLEAADGGGLVVEFAAGPVTVSGTAVTDLRHGWAITVHRAQGSEWPAVVAVLPGDAAGMLSRPLVYTSFTRAQRHLSIVHAAGPAVARAVRVVGARPRRTRLSSLLREGAAQ
ncbi:MAG: exodeoxyribonuclease alpha subunit [Frankiales bacterium]|nr:exodeoxyribonuclease alpha subunit [Frankiales bacterium]